MMNADKALQKLIEGNKRYIEGTAGGAELTITTRRMGITEGQIKIIGAEYSIETGVVDFYHDN